MQIELTNKPFKILGHKYQLQITNIPMLKQSTIATCCSNTLTIEISNIFPQSRQEEALFHEIIEALDYHLGLKLEHDKITALSEGLFQVFKDNF